jgi:hypothetical protein
MQKSPQKAIGREESLEADNNYREENWMLPHSIKLRCVIRVARPGLPLRPSGENTSRRCNIHPDRLRDREVHNKSIQLPSVLSIWKLHSDR